MGTSASEDSDRDAGGIDETLSRISERITETVDRAKPNNPDRWNRVVKIAFSLLLTALYVYWMLAWQLEIEWFEF